MSKTYKESKKGSKQEIEAKLFQEKRIQKHAKLTPYNRKKSMNFNRNNKTR